MRGDVEQAHRRRSDPVRLLSEAGASFALLPAPSLANFDYPYTHLVDIELLTPRSSRPVPQATALA